MNRARLGAAAGREGLILPDWSSPEAVKIDIPQPLRTWVEVDLAALGHNVRTLKNLAGQGRLLMACVKSEAYGHGLVETARAAEKAGADRLAVARVDEGTALRRAGLALPIQVLLEPSPNEAEELLRHRLIPSLSTMKTARALAACLDQPLKVHVEVDTGMGRVPLRPGDTAEFLGFLEQTGRFQVEGLFSHFSSAGEPHDPEFDRFTRSQLASFKDLCEGLEQAGFQIPLKHMASSDAAAFYPESHLDMIRSGAWVYGYKGASVGLDLKPVLSWKTRVWRVTNASAGRPVGYEMAFRPGRDTRIAHLPVGYGDGYPRALSNLGEVLIMGKRLPVAGLVGMESLMVDAGSLEGDLEGREAVLVGRQGKEEITAAYLAEKIGLFGVMITCGIKEKVRRIYLEE